MRREDCDGFPAAATEVAAAAVQLEDEAATVVVVTAGEGTARGGRGRGGGGGGRGRDSSCWRGRGRGGQGAADGAAASDVWVATAVAAEIVAEARGADRFPAAEKIVAARFPRSMTRLEAVTQQSREGEETAPQRLDREAPRASTPLCGIPDPRRVSTIF